MTVKYTGWMNVNVNGTRWIFKGGIIMSREQDLLNCQFIIFNLKQLVIDYSSNRVAHWSSCLSDGSNKISLRASVEESMVVANRRDSVQLVEIPQEILTTNTQREKKKRNKKQPLEVSPSSYWRDENSLQLRLAVQLSALGNVTCDAIIVLFSWAWNFFLTSRGDAANKPVGNCEVIR